MSGGGRAFPIFVLATSAAVMAAVLLAQYWGGLAPVRAVPDRALAVGRRDRDVVCRGDGRQPASVAVGGVVAGGGVRGRQRLLPATMSGSSSIGLPGPSACTAAAGRPRPSTRCERS